MKVRQLIPLNCVLFAGLLLFAGCGKDETEESSSAKKSSGKLSTKPMNRLHWNMDTLVGAYLKDGRRDPSWDEPATNLLARFARIRSNEVDVDETQSVLMNGEAKDAVRSGCDDPLVLYLFARSVAPVQSQTVEESAAGAYRKAAEAMQRVPYPPIRQFYTYLRTAEQLWTARSTREAWPEVARYRQMAAGSLRNALEDPHIPTVEAYEACQALATVIEDHAEQYERIWPPLEAVLLEKWPKESFVYLLQGTARISAAWKSRGGGYSDKVTEEGWKGFSSNLAQAAELLEKAWKLDPTNPEIATEMMRVERGEGKGRERLDLWFNRAMTLNTNLYAACESKLVYLEPKWFGSPQEMLVFGRECVASDKWGGNIPLILMDAHRSLAGYAKREGNTNYWQMPGVWRDLKSAFDKFFALNPDAVGWHHNYAWYAYYCGEWDEFNKRLPLLGSINYSYFGGQETFERMVANARERGSKPPPK